MEKNKIIIIAVFAIIVLMNLNLVFTQFQNPFQNNFFQSQNQFQNQNLYQTPYQNNLYQNQQPNLYNRYQQNPGLYTNNNLNAYNQYQNYNQGYNQQQNQFNNPYYFGANQGFNNQGFNNLQTYQGNNFNVPSRNIQYINPNFQSNTYGGYNNYNQYGQYGYNQGTGAYGLSGLYGYGANNQFNSQLCQQGQDFLLHIAPGGCSPAVVRSDLLEEQNVPVFCRLASFQSNPLLGGTRIRSLRIKGGQYPPGISGVSYFPGRAAINSNSIFNGGAFGGFQGSGFNTFGNTGGFGNNYNTYNQYNTGYTTQGYNSFGQGYNTQGYNTFGQSFNTFGQNYNQYNTGYSSNYGGLFNSNSYLRSNLQSSPINGNMGYLVIVLSRQANESTLPDFIQGNLTATIDYDSTGVFGTGRSSFYLDEMNEETWQREYRENSFWGGKGYIRAESIDQGIATISIYRDANNRDSTITLREGQTSQNVNLGGLYCSAGMRITLERLQAPVDAALLQINDEQVWVSVGDRVINDRCRVTQLTTTGGGGKVTISCPGSQFDLNLNAGKATLEVDGSVRDIGINQVVKNNLYLGYIGRNPAGEDLAVLVRDGVSNSEIAFADKEVFSAVERAIQTKQDIANEVKAQYKRKLTNIDTKNIEVIIIKRGDSGFENIRLTNILVIQDQIQFSDNINSLAKAHYDRSIQNYQELSDLYPNERTSEGEQPLAARGLNEALDLSTRLGLNAKASQFSNQIVENYPDISAEAQTKQNRLFKYDRTTAKKVVNVDNFQYAVDLLEFKKPSRSDASGVFLIDGREVTLGLGEFYNAGNTSLQLLNLDTTRANIGYQYNDGNNNKIARTETLILGSRSQTSLNGVNVKLNSVNLKKQAKVIIQPNLYGTRTEANFQFNIGIEKRAIKLSPEKTKDLIKNLEDTIREWNAINRKLGTVIKTLKGACFATSAILNIKNLFEGATGASIGRNRIMTGLFF